MDPSNTIAFFFDITNTNATPMPTHKRRYFQFLTSYQAANGRYYLRVTTVGGLWHSDPSDHTPVALSFDQEAAAVLMARLAVPRPRSGLAMATAQLRGQHGVRVFVVALRRHLLQQRLCKGRGQHCETSFSLDAVATSLQDTA